MRKFIFSRREFITWVCGGSFFLNFYQFFEKFLIKYKDGPINTLSKVDFQSQFNQSSQFLLGINKNEFNVEISEKIFNELIKSKDLKNKIYALGIEIKKISDKNEFNNISLLSNSSQITAKMILSFWYTGVISEVMDDDTKKSRRLFYDESLMHEFYNQTRPAPGNCGGAFGYWSTPPTRNVQRIEEDKKTNV